MLNDLNDRLARAAAQRAESDKLMRRLSEVEGELRQTKADVARLSRQAQKEEKDVARLEGLSLTGLFREMLGDKEERLRKERQEALAAQLKQHEASQRLQSLQTDLSRLQQELAALQGKQFNYGALLQEKEALISRSGGSGARELLQFSEQNGELRWQIQQLDEAHVAGERADSALARVVDALQSAEGWGTFDMLGGGLIATAIKHSRIDDARNLVYSAQHELAAFRRELKDVTVNVQVSDVSIDGFTKFADFFFDGLIADWVVQSRIHQSLDSVQESRRQVRLWLDWLLKNRAQVEAERSALAAQRDAFIQQFQG